MERGREIGPKISTLLICIIVLAMIYISMIYIATHKGYRDTDASIGIEDIVSAYNIPNVLISEDTQCETTDNGYIHVYNNKGEILIGTDINGTDILAFIDDDRSDVNDEITESVKELLDRTEEKYESITVREYGDDGKYAVSYRIQEVYYGLILIDMGTNSNIAKDIGNLIVDTK